MITGVLPPSICGVGDYTKNVLSTETCKNWKVLSNQKWGVIHIFSLLKKIMSEAPNVVFLQYPAEGYGWSLTPHFILIYVKYFMKQTVVTVLHEYSSFKPKGKLFINLILSKSDGIIFTSEFERVNFLAKNVNSKAVTQVIPILSNIRPPEVVRACFDRDIDLIYFGHIRPNKGFEEFLRAVSEIQIMRPNLKYHIVGQIPSGYESFCDVLKIKYPDYLSCTTVNASPDDVTELLNRSKVCFLPFPDGISERRGSFLAASQCGCAVVSYSGPWLTDRLKRAFMAVQRNNEAQEIVQLMTSESVLEFYQLSALKYHENRNVNSWEDVACEYLKVAEAVNGISS